MTPLAPACNNSQYSAGLFTPPGSRQPIPTTAIGSVSPFSAISKRALKSSILRSASVIIPRRSAEAAFVALKLSPQKVVKQPIFPEVGTARQKTQSGHHVQSG